VPAKRIGSAVYTTAQLKTMQELITLLVFSGFSVFWLGESLTWNHRLRFDRRRRALHLSRLTGPAAKQELELQIVHVGKTPQFLTIAASIR
jgi:hypothetical protein